MSLQQSKYELLCQRYGASEAIKKRHRYELLCQRYGVSEGIKMLYSEGAGLERMNKKGKNPLILASMSPQFYDVAKTLLELGANVNAYRPGPHGGTPLHHAAKRGLVDTVQLLLSHGANALVMNDNCQTALDIARVRGYYCVVRAIETIYVYSVVGCKSFTGRAFLKYLLLSHVLEKCGQLYYHVELVNLQNLSS